ncbi:MAG: pro-sigmaK processing inhibitor BofA family protein [Candidatus Micrarchaeota archaeon]|nr:pro-sigmaK processing inhibitor BofA family protein [Candidatus Micrarchaeota archaeon]MBU1681577.1 pro-sigmaK processing inhibitor BofA family protein [Candidatus Micrarchaeota archaeon]
MSFIIELGTLLVALFLITLILRFFKKPMLVVLNSVLGIIAFFALNFFFGFGIAINFWSVAIVALGGVGGLFFVLVLHFLGIAF